MLRILTKERGSLVIIGYARVSSSGQAVDAQVEQLASAGCEKIFQETVSGTKSERPELRAAVSMLSEGDVLIVTRLDRLARSTHDLLEIVHQIETCGAQLKSLADAWADTASPTGKLILTVLGGLAEFERSLIAERTAEGRERARRAGRRMGRPPKLSEYQKQAVLRMRHEGYNNADIARMLGVSRAC